jgi:hypothetical protein
VKAMRMTGEIDDEAEMRMIDEFESKLHAKTAYRCYKFYTLLTMRALFFSPPHPPAPSPLHIPPPSITPSTGAPGI